MDSGPRQRCFASPASVHSLLLVLIAVLPAAAVAQKTNQFSVSLEGCPTQLQLTIPRTFTRADTPAKQKTRTTILDGLHANKARKARYSEVFLADWSSETALPHVSVSSLGSLIRSQGKITQRDWHRVRDEFLKSTASTRQSMIERQLPRYRAGSAVDVNTIRAEIPALFEEGDTSIVMLGSSTSVVQGTALEILSAAKLAFVHKCIAFVQVALDANAPDALRTLNRYMAQVKIQ